MQGNCSTTPTGAIHRGVSLESIAGQCVLSVIWGFLGITHVHNETTPQPINTWLHGLYLRSPATVTPPEVSTLVYVNPENSPPTRLWLTNMTFEGNDILPEGLYAAQAARIYAERARSDF